MGAKGTRAQATSRATQGVVCFQQQQNRLRQRMNHFDNALDIRCRMRRQTFVPASTGITAANSCDVVDQPARNFLPWLRGEHGCKQRVGGPSFYWVLLLHLVTEKRGCL